jgi:TonB family protein
MYFDFEDKPDIEPIGHAISWREEVLLTVILHLLAVIAIVVTPPMDRSALNARVDQQLALQRQRERDEATRFVFVQPHLDFPATRPVSPRAEGSDKDRNAQASERARSASNAMPFSRGNTFERTEATPPPARVAPAPQPSAQPSPAGQDGGSNSRSATPEPGSPPSAFRETTSPLFAVGPRAGSGKAPDAVANAGAGSGLGLSGGGERQAQQLARQDNFDNPGGGGGQYGQSIQFDSKGVEFGPWIRRFIAQIKRNWLVPLAAMAMKGHVVVQFYVAKDGTVSGLAVPGPCNVSAFNNAAYNAMAASNPTYPLPREYPSDKAFFTVTFYYNEAPPGGSYDR